jgi:hypothetical protein
MQKQHMLTRPEDDGVNKTLTLEIDPNTLLGTVHCGMRAAASVHLRSLHAATIPTSMCSPTASHMHFILEYLIGCPSSLFAFVDSTLQLVRPPPIHPLLDNYDSSPEAAWLYLYRITNEVDKRILGPYSSHGARIQSWMANSVPEQRSLSQCRNYDGIVLSP